ncbi:MarR family transcriptional regulator [Altererythrobacter soli]|uniref:MarR family transcriptional regulator n=1 Tax=Croceibacterium soli TaxID=1739690 RepID=A0A6I4UX48_9SPHN|nr:MarR family transcriptional regulator [Croceibacterium soli]MXP42329.1 MarR family transcriptional regulator [Croceibacterium soli]
MSRHGEAGTNSTGAELMLAPKQQDEWGTVLRDHASALWREAAGGATVERPAAEQLALLGPMAEEALTLVETFTLGALARADANGRARAAEPPEDFNAQLGLILKGLQPSAQALGNGEKPGKPIIFQSELWQVLHKIRESAELSYAHEPELVELDRRILFLLRMKGPLVPADLSSSVGVDKAQVSRSVKRLLELGMVQRAQIRAPLMLTAHGEDLADRLLRLADLRNRELTFDIGDGELSDFFAAIELLLERSVSLYDQERARAVAPDRAERGAEAYRFTERKADDAVLIDRSRIVSPLLTLSAYFSRSGALAFKRSTGLSSFEAWVLNEISMNPPISWGELAAALQRDHSQAGRTVRALIERGLVAREGRPGRRHGKFYPTPEGERLYNIIQQTGIERSRFLMAPLGEQQREKFLATFAKLRRNAVAQLQRERALREFQRD